MRHQQPKIKKMPLETKQLGANSTIAELLDAHPAAAEVLLRHGMACVGCTMTPFETLAEAACEYRIDLRSLLIELGFASGGSQRCRRSAARRSRARSKLKPPDRGEAAP